MFPSLTSILTGASLVASSMFFAPSAPAGSSAPEDSSAKTVSASFMNESGSFESKAESLANNTTRGTKEDVDKLVGKLQAENIKSKSGLKLDLNKAFVLNTDDGNAMLRVPFAGGQNVLEESGVSYFFDAKSNFLESGEIVLTPQNKTSGKVQLWQGQSKVLDRVVEDPNQSKAAGTGTARVGFNWDTFNSCLSNAGIASWAIAAIGVACGAACAATVGVGCVVCATSTAGITGSTIGTCAGQAMA